MNSIPLQRQSNVCPILYYGFRLSLDMCDLNVYVSRVKRTRCYAETATFPRANFLECT